MRVLIVSYYHKSTDAGGRRWRMLAEKMRQDYDATVLCPEKPLMKRDYPYIIRFAVNHLFYPDYSKYNNEFSIDRQYTKLKSLI